MDGTIGNTNRWRYQTLNSAQNTAVTPRLENIAEMVVSSDQIDMNQGFGSSSMTITYITRRGTNRFNGRLYEGFRAEFLDAKNWGSTVKPKYHRNDFGASLGGPILRDKLFFFASMAALDVPGWHPQDPELLHRRREAGHLHLRQRRQGEPLQYLCRAQRGERHGVPCVCLTDQFDDGGAHRGGGRLSAECRRPVFAGSSSRPMRICAGGSGSARIRSGPTTRRSGWIPTCRRTGG